MGNKKPFVKTLEARKKFKRLLGSSSIKGGLCSGFVSLKKGESIGAHSTKKKEELLIVIKGKGSADIEGRKIYLKEGQVLFIPSNTLHDIRNYSARLLAYVYVTARV